MMIGTCEVKNGSIQTNKTTYVITKDTRPDVRRLFLTSSLVVSGGLALFGLGFVDLLYFHELVLIFSAIGFALVIGVNLARLVILDRVTRGTEQMSAIYGLHGTLQEKRHEINAAIDKLQGGIQ